MPAGEIQKDSYRPRFRRAFLDNPNIRDLMAALGGGAQVRIVGGAVRNALLEQAISDIDMATVHLPEGVIQRAKNAGFRVAPTGIDHGTITAIRPDFTCEITTLREDVETDGRRAKVAFGTDWEADARRRDFTMNALAVDDEGQLYDFVGGLEDCLNGRVRFIGDANARIVEDSLRIMRFLRFSTFYGEGPSDHEGLIACAAHAKRQSNLSGERIRQELLKWFSAPRGARLAFVVNEAIEHELFPHFSPREDPAKNLALHDGSDPILRLCIAYHDQPENLVTLAAEYRFSNAEKKRIEVLLSLQRGMRDLSERNAKQISYQHGKTAFLEALQIAVAGGESLPGSIEYCRKLMHDWEPGTFPLSGQDLLDIGFAPGERLGAALKKAERHWIDQDFAPLRADLIEFIKTQPKT